MSTASLVPETWELSGDEALTTLRDARFSSLLKDSIKRFRSADGFSHSRSLAFAVLLTVIPGIIAVVGLATVSGEGSFRKAVADALHSVSPGPSSDILTAAIQQGTSTAADHGVAPLIFGLIATIISGVTAFGQVERGANRIYGIELDRPFVRKYSQALRLLLSSGVLLTAGFVLVGLGRSVVKSLELPGPEGLWFVVRGIVGIAVSSVSFALLFRLAPRRRQPHLSWLIVGSSIALLLWVVATVGLALLWRFGSTFGNTYGPLAGLMGFALWAYLIAIGLFIGLAVAAELEACRAGSPEPQDAHKVAQSQPH